MKILKTLLAVLFFTTMGMVTTSCEDEDEDAMECVGTWEYRVYPAAGGTNTTTYVVNENTVYTYANVVTTAAGVATTTIEQGVWNYSAPTVIFYANSAANSVGVGTIDGVSMTIGSTVYIKK